MAFFFKEKKSANYKPAFFIMNYEELIDERVLLEALEKCTKNAIWKHSVQDILKNKLAVVCELHDQLLKKDFSFPSRKEFDIIERGKARHIKAPSVKERVVQRAICDNVLVPILSPSLIFDCPATLKGKGVSFARKRLLAHLTSFLRLFGVDGYILQIDFKNYFAKIDHEKLFSKISQKITDKNIFALIQSMVKNDGSGLGLGSEISQILALYYASQIDHFCKEVLRLKFYGRYMDDIYAIHTSRIYLEECLEKIRTIALFDKIELNKKKTKIIPIKSGFTFLKIRYRLTASLKILRLPDKSTFKREKRRLRKMSSLLRSGVLTLDEISNAYKSWRQSLKKFDCHKRLNKCDSFFKKEFTTDK